jgi:hypothetical protein
MALNPSIKFKDQAAEVVWAAICTLEERAQHEVLAALGERLSFPDERATAHEIRVARGVAALREAAALAGHSPSVPEYRRLRDENPERAWPDDSPIRQWLGGNWNDALAAAGLDAPPDPIAHYPERGPEFSDEECLAAIRECAGDLDVPMNNTVLPPLPELGAEHECETASGPASAGAVAVRSVRRLARSQGGRDGG